MSRIYHDSALQNKAVQSARLPGAWDPAAHQGGDGVLLEGELVDVSRHSISDAHGRKGRTQSIQKFPGSGSDWSCGCQLTPQPQQRRIGAASAMTPQLTAASEP